MIIQLSKYNISMAKDACNICQWASPLGPENTSRKHLVFLLRSQLF